MGDPRAEASYDVFFQTSWARLQGQAYVLTGSQELAQDLTQEALLRAWTHWAPDHRIREPRGLDPPGPPQPLHPVLAKIPGPPLQRPPRSDDNGRRSRGPRPVGPGHAPTPGGPGPGPATPRRTGNDRRRDRPGLGVPEGTVKSWLSRTWEIVAANLNRSVRSAQGGGEA